MAPGVVLNPMNFTEYSYIIPYIRYCAEDKYQNPWYLRNRKIGDYEFLFITRGEGQFDIDGRLCNVKTDDLILFKPNTFHQGKSISLPFEFLCIHFDLYVSKEKNSRISDQQRLDDVIPMKPIKYKKAVLDLQEHITIRDSSYMHILLKKIIREVNGKQPGFNIIIKSLFIDFLVELVRKTEGNEGQKRLPDAVLEMIEYIKMNYMRKILLSDLSKHVHLEPTYVSNLFKRYTGCSITEYLKTYRLSVAKGLLLETDSKIDEIAYRVGFYDLHHFSKVFKLQEGIAPSQYRQIKRY